MPVPITVIIQSIASVAQVGAELALLLQRSQSGTPVTEDEWRVLRSRVSDAERDWEES